MLSSPGTGGSIPTPSSSLEAHEVVKGRRHRPHATTTTTSTSAASPMLTLNKVKRQPDGMTKSQSLQGLGVSRKGSREGEEEDGEGDFRGSFRDGPLCGSLGSGEMLDLPMPIRIERRGKNGLLNVDDQRRLRRRWSGVMDGIQMTAGESASDGDSTGSSDGEKSRMIRRQMLSARQASGAQKVSQSVPRPLVDWKVPSTPGEVVDVGPLG